MKRLVGALCLLLPLACNWDQGFAQYCQTSGACDAGLEDAGLDGGSFDAGPTDAGAADAGLTDAGKPWPVGRDGGPANYAFVTEAAFDGLLGGLSGADARCQAAADDAGLPGRFVAFLATTDGGSALARLSGAEGWFRPDGLPLGDRIELLAQARFFSTFAQTEHQRVPDLFAWTGTANDGGLGQGTCLDWTSNDHAQEGSSGGTFFVNVGWLGNAVGACDTQRALYCFGVDHAVRVSPPVRANARVAFVTAATVPSGGGVAAFDGECQSEATQANYQGTFLALVANGAGSAFSRFDLDGGPWARADHALLAPSAQALATNPHAAAVPNLTATGAYVFDFAWSGASSPTAVDADAGDCSGWTSTDTGTRAVHTSLSDTSKSWFSSGQGSCADAFARVLCFQR